MNDSGNTATCHIGTTVKVDVKKTKNRFYSKRSLSEKVLIL